MAKPLTLFSPLIFLMHTICGHTQEDFSKNIGSANVENKITVKLCGDNPDEIWLNITKSRTETSPSLLQLDKKNPNRQFSADKPVQADRFVRRIQLQL